MLTSSRRLAAVAIVLALAAWTPAVCAGWMPTPEARMACCFDDHACPMHESDSHDASTPSQARADSCCAASEGRDSAPSASAFVLALSVAPISGPVPFVVPEPPQSDARRTLSPIPGPHIPKHLLLSVFLV